MSTILRSTLSVAIALLLTTPLFAQKETWISDLNSEDPTTQMRAARALGEIEESDAVNPLIQMMESTDNNHVAATAAAALGAIGQTGAATDALIRMANQTTSPVVQYAALLALANLQDEDKKDEAIAAAEKIESSTNDEYLKDLAARVRPLLDE